MFPLPFALPHVFRKTHEVNYKQNVTNLKHKNKFENLFYNFIKK